MAFRGGARGSGIMTLNDIMIGWTQPLSNYIFCYSNYDYHQKVIIYTITDYDYPKSNTNELYLLKH